MMFQEGLHDSQAPIPSNEFQILHLAAAAHLRILAQTELQNYAAESRTFFDIKAPLHFGREPYDAARPFYDECF